MENLLSLPILVFSPLIAILILFIPIFNGKAVLIRRFAKSFASVHLVYSLSFVLFFDMLQDDGLAFYQNIKFFGKNWLDIIGGKFALGVDNLSVLLMTLVSFIFLLAFIASKNNITTNTKFYYSLLFLLETSFLGIFCAQDMFLFAVFWMLSLVPVYFLISLWGTGNCKRSAMKFLIFNFSGAFLILIGILLLHFYNFAASDKLTAEFSEIEVLTLQFPMFMQMFISILLLTGLMIRIPVFPFHTYFIDSCSDAPSPVSMLLSSIGCVSGVYGIILFNIRLLSETFVAICPVLVILTAISVMHCTLTAFAQEDFKKSLSYLAVSSVSLSLFGLYSFSSIGYTGVLFAFVSNSIILTMLFMIAGIIFLRTKTYDIVELGGLGHVMPRLYGLSLIVMIAFAGFPFLSNFTAIFMTLYSFIKYAFFDSEIVLLIPVAVVLPLTLILNSANIIKLIHKIFVGNIYERWNIGGGLADITNHELLILIMCLFVIIYLGIFPMNFINFVQPVVGNLIGVM